MPKTSHLTSSFFAFLCLLTFSLLANYQAYAKTTFFDQSWLKAVVSIERSIPEQNIEQSIGTGFLVNTPGGNIVLVTAKHVIFDKDTQIKKKHLAYRINLINEPSKLLTEAQLTKTPGNWFRAEKADVALHFFPKIPGSNLSFIPHDKFVSIKKILPGAPALTLGFPLGLRSNIYTEPIVRRAMVAGKDSYTILIDGFAFPGNSGGPVVYHPPASFFDLTGKIDAFLKQQLLIGVVSRYVPYQDIYESRQTQKQRIVFEDNSGLTKIIPTDEIIKIMNSQKFKAIDTSN